ncbi:MAG: hypothetical protein RIC89_20995 [Pseudomonadales bacterium]
MQGDVLKGQGGAVEQLQYRNIVQLPQRYYFRMAETCVSLGDDLIKFIALDVIDIEGDDLLSQLNKT